TAASPPSAPGPRPSTDALGSPLSIPAATHAPRLGVRFRPSLGGAVALGLVPGLAPGLEFGLELRMNQFWPVVMQGTGFLEQHQTSSVPTQGATFAAQTL